jgi:hypothetical protein
VKAHPSRLPLPVTRGEDTIYEYMVENSGQWEHWQHRVCVTAILCIPGMA